LHGLEAANKRAGRRVLVLDPVVSGGEFAKTPDDNIVF
jgi:hypothetical protein